MRLFSVHIGSIPLAAFSVLTVLGCGGGGGGGGGGGVPLDDIPDRYAAASCEHLERCLGSFTAILFGSNCADELSTRLQETVMPLWRAAIDAGTLEYDPNAAADCLDDLRDAACDAPGVRGTACDDVFRGTVAAGGACRSHEECAGDAFCDVDASCPGECRARGGAGASCDDDDACMASLECIDGSCTTPLTIGDACDEDNDACGGLSTCIAGRCTTIQNNLTAAIDASCDPEAGMLCEAGASCVLTGIDPGTRTPQWRCVGPSNSGGSCNLGFPDPCPDDQYCDADPETTLMFEGTCQPLPSVGEACRDGGNFAARECEGDLVCSDGVCRNRKLLGSPCDSDRECYSGFCDSDVCTAPMCQGTP